jgi:NADPH:quinone reductase-like Zn-dependent oxidoreductase
MDGLVLEERAIPEIGPCDVLVRVHASSLNRRDLLVAEGISVGGEPRLGAIPLSDGAGEVVATGTGVSRLKVGQGVIGLFRQRWLSGPNRPEDSISDLGCHADGMLAEFVALAEDGLCPFPDHLSFAEAATLPCAAAAAWCALFPKASMNPGETVVTLGTGAVSLFVTQLAAAAGARVIVLTSRPQNAGRLRDLGATHVVDWTGNKFWHRSVLALTDGLGADILIETGGAATYPESLRALRPGGRLSIVGILNGLREEAPTFDTIFFRDLTVRAVQPGSRLDLEALLRAIAASLLRPVIDSSFAFDDARQAFARLAEGGPFGKIVVRHD